MEDHINQKIVLDTHFFIMKNVPKDVVFTILETYVGLMPHVIELPQGVLKIKAQSVSDINHPKGLIFFNLRYQNTSADNIYVLLTVLSV